MTRDIVTTNLYPAEIQKLIDDPDVRIRANSYRAMLAMTHQEPRSQILIGLEMVHVLVNHLYSEKDESILLLIHELLRQLLLVENGTERAILIEDETITGLCSFLEHHNEKVSSSLVTFAS